MNTDPSPGDEVVVEHGEVRGEQDATVTRVPPFERTVVGETVVHETEVEVEYKTGGPFGRALEVVPIESVRER